MTTGAAEAAGSIPRPLRAAGGVAGVALIAWTIVGPPFRGADGFPTSAIVLPVCAGMALLLVSLAAGTVFGRAAAWIGLLLVGHASALRLIDAGTRLHYQHYLPWRSLLAADPLATGILAAQVALVAIGLVRLGGRIAEWRRGAMRAWQAAALAVVLVLCGAALSEDPRAWIAELGLAAIVQGAGLGGIVLAAASLPGEAVGRLARTLDRLLGSATDDGGRPRAEGLAWAGAGFVLVVTGLLAFLVYERHPHVQDEVKYLYQARYLAAGLIAMPPPPVPAAFEMTWMDIGPRGWFSTFPPGWPAVLALGVPAGAAWLVNPVLSAAAVVLLHPVTWRLHGRRTARLVTILLCASPWYLFLGMSYMAHPLTLVLLLLAVHAVLRARDTSEGGTGGWWWTWPGGFAIGAMSLVRQLDALVVALLLGLWAIGLGGRRLRVPSIAGLVLGTALGAALTLPYNAALTGDGARFPMMAYSDRAFGANSHAYGFGPDRGMGWELDPFPGHGPADALVNAALNTSAIHQELFGWMAGSLGLVAFLVLGARVRGNDRLGLALIAGIFVAYFFNYFGGGPDFGARYWYLMLVPLVILTARGASELAATLTREPRGRADARVTAAVLALAAAALVSFMPWRATDKYRGYLGMRPTLHELAQQQRWGAALVLVRGRENPDYSSAAVYNPVDVRASAPVYARDRDDSTRAALLAAYADRPVYLVDGPTRTGSGYRVVAGPLRADSALTLPPARP